MKLNITTDEGALLDREFNYNDGRYRAIGCHNIEDVVKMTAEQFWAYKKKGYGLQGVLNVIDTLLNLDTGMTIEVTRKALHYSTRQHRKAA